jgi:hypothetical protein
VAFGVLAAPEALVAAPLLEVPGQGLVEVVGVALADVDDDRLVGGVALADDVDAGLAAQRLDPVGVARAAGADGAVRERSGAVAEATFDRAVAPAAEPWPQVDGA